MQWIYAASVWALAYRRRRGYTRELAAGWGRGSGLGCEGGWARRAARGCAPDPEPDVRALAPFSHLSLRERPRMAAPQPLEPASTAPASQPSRLVTSRPRPTDHTIHLYRECFSFFLSLHFFQLVSTFPCGLSTCRSPLVEGGSGVSRY